MKKTLKPSPKNKPIPYLQRPVHTRRLCIKMLKSADVSALRCLLEKDEKEFLKHMRWPEDLKLEDPAYLKILLSYFQSKMAKRTREQIFRFIFKKSDQEIMGVIRTIKDKDGDFHVTAFLVPSERGKGYGREAMAATLRQLADESGAARLVVEFVVKAGILKNISLDTPNTIRLYKSLGFTFDCRRMSRLDHVGAHRTDFYTCAAADIKLTNPAP